VNRIPELIPISEIRQRQNEILASLRNGPIVLTAARPRRGCAGLRPASTIGLWQRWEDLEDAMDAAEAHRDPARWISTSAWRDGIADDKSDETES